MFKRAERKWDLYVGEGEIRAYDDAGRLVADVSRVGDGIYKVEDYRGGWRSPNLDWVGAWNLARELGVTKEEFREAFGVDVDSDVIVVDIKTFVRWFFRAGALPIKLDDGISGILPDIITEWMIDVIAEEATDYAEEHGYSVDSEEIRYCVGDVVDVVGMVDKMSEKEIFNKLLLPVFGDDIRVSGNKVEVSGDFIDVCVRKEGELIEYLKDYFIEAVDIAKIVDEVVKCVGIEESRENIE
jgi:hypothetical protein